MIDLLMLKRKNFLIALLKASIFMSRDNRFQRSELDWLIYNDPASYADLILNGNPEKYLKECGRGNCVAGIDL